MDLNEFRASLAAGAPPPQASLALAALWREAKGDWEAAHELCNRAGEREGAWVHAYLHRVEGDLSNADYWYRRAGRTRASTSTAQEWQEIVEALLDTGP